MGSVIRARSTTVKVHAAAASTLREIALVGPEGELAKVSPGGDEGTLEAETSAPWSYVRVVQDDGEMAWSSPIFLEP